MRSAQPNVPVTYNRQIKVAICLLTAGALGVFAALEGIDLWMRHGQVIAAAGRQADNVALILSRHIRETFASADASLRQLVLHGARVGGPAAASSAWTASLQYALAGLPAVGSLTVVDANGIIRHSTIPGIAGQSRRDEYVFQRLATDSADVIVASTPFRTQRDSAMLVIPLGRRLSAPDGRFLGAVVATFSPEAVRDVFRAVDVGTEGKVWLLHGDSYVLVEEPARQDGTAPDGGTLFEAAGTVGGNGVWRGRLAPGGPALIAAFRMVPAPALVVGVGLSRGEVLAFWRRDVVRAGVILALLGATAVLLLWALFRQIDARLAAQAALVRGERLQSLGQLTGGVAHDFNNLLTVILGNVALLKPGASSGSEELEEIERAGRRAVDLTRGLLAFARRQQLQPAIVDLNRLIQDARPLLARALEEHVALTVRAAEAPCLANVDEAQLETALVNLCVNARDAMPDGGILVIETARASLDAAYARQHEDVAPGRYVMISVSDSGQGIPAKDLERIFEPFFTTKDPAKGTGLGLSMVYGFVKQSGGHVKAYSEIGHGTAFKLYFPEATGTVAPRAQPPAVEARGAGELILVVEDEDQVRRLATRILERLGYRVIAAADGPSALALAREHPDLDLLLTDVILPGGMSGKDVAATLTRERPTLPVIFASGYSAELVFQAGHVGHWERHVPKPYDPAKLAAEVRAALSAPAA